jgi:hypothetical protein
VQELELLFPELGELHVVDATHDLTERAVDEWLIRADLADPEHRPLPEVVVVGLGDRDVELVADARLDRSQNAALPFNEWFS